jgi:hypothetical protein
MTSIEIGQDKVYYNSQQLEQDARDLIQRVCIFYLRTICSCIDWLRCGKIMELQNPSVDESHKLRGLKPFLA